LRQTSVTISSNEPVDVRIDRLSSWEPLLSLVVSHNIFLHLEGPLVSAIAAIRLPGRV
jgi:hypothetical protein